MSSHALTLELSPQEFSERKAAIAAMGIAVPPGDAGELSHSGVTVGFSYNGTDMLAITVLKKPLFFPKLRVETQILAWFQEA